MEAIQLLGLDTPWTMAERGDLEGMQMAAAVDHTLDFDRPDLAQGWTPVMYASSQDHPAVVAWLRASRGVDMHREGRDGLTCVFLAATGGSLIKYDCDEVDCHDMSPTEALCHGDQGAASLHGARLECACVPGADQRDEIGYRYRTVSRPPPINSPMANLASKTAYDRTGGRGAVHCRVAHGSPT